MNSKVSVVMPCFNAAKYINKSIESILKQTYTNWELIIVDDGSTDESLQIMKQYASVDKRIKIITNYERKGPGGARNIALRACSGNYIAFLDADDIAKPKRLEKEVAFLDCNKDYGAVGGQAQILGMNDHISGVSSCPTAWSDIQKSIFFKNPFINSSMMFRKCIVDKYKLSFDESLRMGEDYLFWINMCGHCRIQILKENLIVYRVNDFGLRSQWAFEMNHGEKCSKEHQYIYNILWGIKGIDVSSCNSNQLINALSGKEDVNVFEVIKNAVNVIKYGLIICNNKYDNVIFREVKDCIKRLYRDTKVRYKSYNRQFQAMRSDVHKYGNYPYPKYMILSQKKLIYLEIPKVANCSIKASMLQKKFKDDYSVQAESLKYTVHNLGEKYDDFYKFTFVRNPLDRVVSCYESKYHKDKQMFGKYRKDLEFDGYLFGYIRKDQGFTNFLCRIALIPDAYKDHHFKPQYNIVYDRNGRKNVDYVGKYEKLNQEYQQISEKFNLNQLDVYNKTDRKSYMEYYNLFTTYLVYFIYRKDIKYFGYEKEYRELLEYVRRKKKKG